MGNRIKYKLQTQVLKFIQKVFFFCPGLEKKRLGWFPYVIGELLST